VHDDEEPANDGTGRNIWVQLTYPSDKHGPGYTAEEPAHIGIDGPPYRFNNEHAGSGRVSGETFELTLSPMLDTPQGISEYPHVWY